LIELTLSSSTRTQVIWLIRSFTWLMSSLKPHLTR